MSTTNRQGAIRAVHILRDDHTEHLGGDIAELRGVVAGLSRHGVEVTASTLDEAPSEIDVVHLYNLWLPRQLVRAEAKARRRWPRARIAITPIFGTFPLLSVLAVRERAIAEIAVRRVIMGRVTWLPVRRVLRRADLLLPNHRAEADLLARYFRLGPQRQISLLPNGTWVDDWKTDRSPVRRRDLLASHGLSPTASPLVACVARVEPRKNQVRLVEAVAALPDAALILVGPASAGYGQRVLRLASELLPGRFGWLGRQPQPVVRDVLSAADVHALPSFLEVHCTADIEAAAAGCEVVVTATPATHELWGELVFPCAPHSAASIAAAIRQAIASPRQPGTSARAEAFDFDVLGARAAAIYRDAIA